MALGDALGAEYLNTGAVLLSHKFEFGDFSKAKFCVVLEGYDGGRETTIVVLTTSNDKYKGKPWVVTLPDGTGGLNGECYLDCNNIRELPTQELAAHERYRYIGQLPVELVEDIFLAMEDAYKVPEVILIRLFGE